MFHKIELKSTGMKSVKNKKGKNTFRKNSWNHVSFVNYFRNFEIEKKFRVFIQGPPTLSVFFNLDILGSYKAATMLFSGSNWPQLNDIWWNVWKNHAHVLEKFQQSKSCRNQSYGLHEFDRYYLQIKCLHPKNFNLKHE